MADRGQLGNGPGTHPDMTRAGAGGGRPNRGLGKFQVGSDTKPVPGAHTLTQHYEDNRDAEFMARMYEESVDQPNLANNQFVQDQARYAVLSGLKDVFNVMEFLRNKWLIMYRLYRGETLNEVTYGRLQLHSPEPYKIVETLHPKLMRTLFGSDKWFKLYGEQAEHDANAIAQEALCRNQLREMQFHGTASTFIRNGLIYGTAVQKTWWKQEKKHMRYRHATRKPHPTIPGATVADVKDVNQEELVYDANCTQEVEIFDFLTSPSANSVDEAEWCMDRTIWPDFKIKAMAEAGHWLNCEALEDYQGDHDSTFGDEFKERKSYAYGIFDPREAGVSPHIPHYQVLDWWGPLVIKDEGGNYTTRECNVVMVGPEGPQIIVRVTENPFWHGKKPYQVWKPVDLRNEFYGIGAIEMIARLSREKDVKRQLLMAASQLEANPAWAVSDQANIPPGQFMLHPGSIFRVPDVNNSIAPLHVPQVSDSALKAENVLTVDIRETAGTNSPSMGAQDPFGTTKTATQHTSEIDMTNLRIADMVSNYENQVVVPMLNQMTWNNQQFMSYARVIRDIGPVGVGFRDRWTINPEDLIGKFLVQPLSSYKLLTKQTLVQQLTNLLDRAPVINQQYGPTAVNQPKLLAYILEQGFDIRNADEFVTIPESESSLLTPIQEHEMWYHGNVPDRRQDDNDLRHIMSHLEEFEEERFQRLAESDPQTANKARQHAAMHIHKLALLQDRQEFKIMNFAQQAAEMGVQVPPGLENVDFQGADMGQGQQEGGVAGAAGPGNAPDSPNFRSNEIDRGDGQQAQSGAMQGAPNPGAQ
jgi:hypothetical protein